MFRPPRWRRPPSSCSRAASSIPKRGRAAWSSRACSSGASRLGRRHVWAAESCIRIHAIRAFGRVGDPIDEEARMATEHVEETAERLGLDAEYPLTDEHVDSLHEDGWARLPGLLS